MIITLKTIRDCFSVKEDLAHIPANDPHPTEPPLSVSLFLGLIVYLSMPSFFSPPYLFSYRTDLFLFVVLPFLGAFFCYLHLCFFNRYKQKVLLGLHILYQVMMLLMPFMLICFVLLNRNDISKRLYVLIDMLIMGTLTAHARFEYGKRKKQESHP
jgi:hypothetical protein